MIALPDWLPQELWAAWLDMRKKCKKPATEYAEKLALKELYKLQGAGQDPVACVEQSILRCWTAFYAVKGAQVKPAESFRERDERLARERYEEAMGIRPPQSTVIDMVYEEAKPRLLS